MCSILKRTMWEILSDPKRLRILIPRIQRDYAHGRADKAAKEVRTTLVAELIDSLSKGAPPNDLARGDLGLVFGAADEDVMTLYDGQQRFTTLFLLHWSLAWFARDTSAAEVLQRFSYNSRLHSRDFCHALTTYGLQIEQNGTRPSQCFLDETWFCPSWCTDPTVAGMLVVLDLMHESLLKGKQDAAELLSQLKYSQAPCFSWLVLRKEENNEDLYVKLNSRGRNLTEFEKLKAWLERLVKENESWKDVALPEEWKRKLDNQWLDLFWKHSESNPKTMDGAILAFFLGNASNLAISGKEGFDSKLIQTVHDKGFLSKEEWGKIFTKESLPHLLRALDHLTMPEVRRQIDLWGKNSNILLFSSQDTAFPLSTALIAGWTRAVFRQRLLYFGLLRFLIECPPGSPGWMELLFLRWMRLVRNLGENSRLTSDTLQNAIQSIQSIAPNQLQLLDQWVSEQPKEVVLPGLDHHQWQDEIEKAKLRLAQNREDVTAALSAVEDQPFLRGQIGFLIAFATSNDAFDLKRFQSYSAAMARHFPTGDGPSDVDRVSLQQALLSIGDYSGGDGRKCLASNRDDWRNLFRSEITKHEKHKGDQHAPQSILKAFLDLGAKVDLNEIVNSKLANLEWSDWRKWMLGSRHPLEFCESSRFEVESSEGTVVLIKGKDYRSAATELRTYFLFKEKLEPLGWHYEKWGRNSRACRNIDGRIRLELLHVASKGFALRVLCKENVPPLGFDSSLEAFQLRDDEKTNGWESCGLRYLEWPYTPETMAKRTQDEWQNLADSF